MNKKLRMISLFSGIGSFEKALDNLKIDYDLVGFSEIDKYAIQSYCAIHNVSNDLNLGDVSKVNFSKIKNIDLVVGGSPCFKEGTLISTNKGLKLIEEIKVNDLVLTHKKRYQKVLSLMITPTKDIDILDIEGLDSVYVTSEHPYFVITKTKEGIVGPYWKAVKDLNTDDYIGTMFEGFNSENIIYKDGYSFVKFISKRTLRLKESIDVYNFEVEEDNSYIANGAIVHNCQDFSTAGKQNGSAWTCLECKEKFNPLFVNYEKRDRCPHCNSLNLEKTRSSLIVEYLRVIRETKPKYFVYENVKGILNKSFKDGFLLFLEELKEYGYDIHYKVLNSKDYGVPQHRTRVFVVGVRSDLKQDYTFPKEYELKTYLKDLLEPTVDSKYYIKSSNARIKTFVNQMIETKKLNLGLNPCDATINKPKILDVANCLTTRVDSGIQTYRSIGVVILEKYQKTVLLNDPNFNLDKTYMIEDDNYIYKVRKLTPRETFLLMGFEENDAKKCIDANISNTQLYRQTGNSIVVDVSENILKELIPKTYYK